jgi:hypothetical protein
MSSVQIPTYAPALALPPPVTSGSTIQTFTDVYGDAWVAMNGVRNGIWMRARDVVGARVYRPAAFTPITSAWTFFGFNAATFNLFNLNNGGNFTCPVAGLYLCSATYSWGATTTAYRCIAAIYRNGAEVSRGMDIQGTANTGMNPMVHDVVLCAAGDVLSVYYYITQPAASVPVATSILPFSTVQYLGTG